MKIVFDLMHPAHINFFKNAIFKLSQKNHDITLLVLDRGKVPQIVKKELPGFKTIVVGKHQGSFLSIIFQANLFRFFSMYWLLIKEKPKIGFSVGSFILGMNLRLRMKKNYQFDDDPERKLNVFLEKLTSTKLFFPVFFIGTTSKVSKYNALKEWAYLSPKYFNANSDVLSEYGLTQKQYIFVREISAGSLNYSGQNENLIASISENFPQNIQVILSLEDKKTIDQYPKDWILLKEPLKDIHSLIYFSKLVISSGDSMAREGAMLGVSSIYCGVREMGANKVLIDKKMLLHVSINQVPIVINNILEKRLIFEDQVKFRNQLFFEWDDVTEFIIDKVENVKN